jgi:hypothetical protein
MEIYRRFYLKRYRGRFPDVVLDMLESNYYISNLGNIKSVKTGKVVQLKPQVRKRPNNGRQGPLYLVQSVEYRDPTDQKLRRPAFYVHILVLDAFIENPDPRYYDYCNHIDGDSQNNKATNLEWSTNALNQIHSRDVLGNVNEQNRKPVIQLDKKTREPLKTFVSTKEADKAVGVSEGCVAKAAGGFTHTSGGYRWVYEEDYKKIGGVN